MRKTVFILVPILFTAIILLSAFREVPEKAVINHRYFVDEADLPPMQYRYLPVFDTVFVLGDEYIEISLREQLARLFRRNDSTLSFKISTGTDVIKQGKSTPEGIYTVQSKSPMAVSKQFNNAKLYNWIGFNMNIGFHGLDAKGYYGSLGIRPTSHGCVRISLNDGEQLYKKVHLGTPVLVYKSKSARILRFSDWSQFHEGSDVLLTDASASTQKMMNARLNMFYSGLANALLRRCLFLSGSHVIKPGGFPLGNADKIAHKQEFFPLLEPDEPAIKDHLRFVSDYVLKSSKEKGAGSTASSASRQ